MATISYFLAMYIDTMKKYSKLENLSAYPIYTHLLVTLLIDCF